jgi:hypothetical protein
MEKNMTGTTISNNRVTHRHPQTHPSRSSIAAFIRCSCLLMGGRIDFTEPLLSNDRSDTLRCHDIHAKPHKIDSAIQKIMGGGGGLTDTQHGDRKSLLPFFTNRESALKILISSLLPRT